MCAAYRNGHCTLVQFPAGQTSVTAALDEVEVAQSVATPQHFRHAKSSQKPRA